MAITTGSFLESLIEFQCIESCPGRLSRQPLGPLLWPWISFARHRYDLEANPGFKLLSAQASEQLDTWLLRRLIPFLAPVLSLEFNICRLTRKLSFGSADEQLQEFINLQQGRWAPFFEEYAILPSKIECTMDLWAKAAQNLLSRLHDDQALLATSFNHGQSLGSVSDITYDLSDLHHGNQSVVSLRFASGCTLVYKPKDITVDSLFQELLLWIDEQEIGPQLKPHHILARGSYGWCEHVGHAHMTKMEQIHQYYCRCGMLLGLIYVLAGSDMHMGNLIAHGEYPLLIDLESLLTQVPGRWSVAMPPPEADCRAFEFSVMNTALLPMPPRDDAAVKGNITHMTGLKGSAEKWRTHNQGVHAPHVNLNTLTFQSGQQAPRALGFESHQAVFEGAVLDPSEYVNDIIKGFQAVYKFVSEHRQAFCGDEGWISRMGNHPVRHILCATRKYALVLEHLCIAEVLRHVEDWKKELTECRGKVSVVHQEHAKAIGDAEDAALAVWDIPVFTQMPCSRHLYCNGQLLVRNFFDEPATEVSKRRIAHMGPEDERRQVALIRKSLA